MTKAFRFSTTGGPDVLRLEDIEVGAPGPREVRIRNTPVNPHKYLRITMAQLGSTPVAGN